MLLHFKKNYAQAWTENLFMTEDVNDGVPTLQIDKPFDNRNNDFYQKVSKRSIWTFNKKYAYIHKKVRVTCGTLFYRINPP